MVKVWKKETEVGIRDDHIYKDFFLISDKHHWCFQVPVIDKHNTKDYWPFIAKATT